MLPGNDGLETCARFAGKAGTAGSDSDRPRAVGDRVTWLDAVWDAYSRSRSVHELLARLRALTRRAPTSRRRPSRSATCDSIPRAPRLSRRHGARPFGEGVLRCRSLMRPPGALDPRATPRGSGWDMFFDSAARTSSTSYILQLREKEKKTIAPSARVDRGPSAASGIDSGRTL